MTEGKSRRGPGIAVLLSLTMPGLGHMYSGRLARGALLLAAAVVFAICLGFTGIFFHVRGLCALLLVETAPGILIAVDAALVAARTKEVELKRYNRWYYYVIVIVAAYAIIPLWLPLYKNYVLHGTTYQIPSASMEPTLLVGDRIVARLWPYKHGTMPKRGDVVIFPYPYDLTKLFINRIVALEGEKLEIRNKAVFINDKQLKDPWGVYTDNRGVPGNSFSRDNLPSAIVPADCVFVMGDNRDHNLDSRFFGFVGVKT
jgi:signal peptidase I